jgi:hypothetical protein
VKEFGRPLAAMSLEVVGVQHPNADKSKSNRRFEIMLCKPGDRIELRPEPKNEKDPQAVAVFSDRGVQIGYVRAERAPRIRQIILEGRELNAVFQAEVERGAWIRVAFDGEVPVVPEADLTRALQRPRSSGKIDAEPEFYPDEIWPDD